MSKRLKFAPMILAAVFFSASFAPSALGQTAQSLIQTGRNALKKQTNAGLQEAKTAFGRAVQAQPTNGEAIVLEVLTTIVAEVLRPEFRQELGALGVQVTNDNIYLPSYQYPQDEEGNYVPPQGVRSDRAKAYANTRLSTVNPNTRLSEVDRLLGLLQRINEQNFSIINLSAQETGLKAVRIDFMDVRMLRVIGRLLKASIAGANSYNTSFEYRLLYRAVTEELTLQQLLAELPDLFKFATAAQRTEAREQLRLANIEFQAAVQFYFGPRQNNSLTPFLFEFEDSQEASESAEVAQFLAAALYGPQTIPADVADTGSPFIGKTINFAPLFTSNTPLRSLLPTRYDRGLFRRDSWPSPTFGGVLGSPDTDLLNEIGAGLGLVHGALYEPYDFSLLLGGDAPPPGSVWPIEQAYRPFTEISSIAVDKLGNIYIADAGLNVIRRLSPDGKLTTVAGQEWTSWSQRDELLRKSSLHPNTGSNPNSNTAVLERPGALAVDPSNNLYFASRGRIFKLTVDGKLAAIAGSDASPWNNQSADGIGGLARFSQITAMGADKDGNVYAADGGTVLKKISPQGLVTTLAGAFNQNGYTDSSGAQARFGWIEGSIAVDSKGAVYVADAKNGCIRKVEPSGLVSTFVGNRGSQTHFDAVLGKARVAWPRGVTIDAAGNLYFLDNTTVRKVSVDGKVATLAGKPWSGNEEFEKMGVGENVRFGDWPYYPNSLSASADGKIYASNYRSIFVGKSTTLDLGSGGGGGGASSSPNPTGPPWPVPPSAAPRTGAGQLDSLSLGRTSVTIEGFPAQVEVVGSYRGNIASFSAEFKHQETGRSLYTSYTNLNHPTAPNRSMTESRSLSAFIEIPANTRSGEWKLERVSYSDANGTYVPLTGTDIPQGFRNLAFTVTNPDGGTIDETPPLPIAIQVTPSDINLDFYPQDATIRPRVRLTVSDASHLSNAYIWFSNPNDSNSGISASFSGHQLVEINGAQKTYEADLYLPAGAPLGDWQIQSLSLSDEAGNGSYFSNSSYYYGTSLPNGFAGTIFRLGGSYPAYVPPVDATAPFVSDLQISPASVDLSTGRKKATMRLQVSDDVSGLRDISANLNSSTGSTTFFSQFKLVSGNHRNGAYEAQIVLPQATPDGVHVAHYLWLTDNAGNGISYSEYAEAPWGRPLTTQLRKTLTVTGGNHPAPTGSVTSITASPTTLNTLPGNAELTFRLSIQGQSQPVNSWTPNGSVGIHSPSGTQYLWSEFGPAHLISISGATRTYEVVFRLPQYSEQGLWRLDYIQLSGQDSDTPSAYVMSANLSAAGLTPPSFTVQGVDRSWQQELVSLESDKEIVELSFGNLNFLFDGTEKRATATATAASVGLGTENIVFTYNGLTTAPIDVGTYQVVAFLDAPQFRGRAESLLTIINSDPHRVAKHLGRGIYATESGRAYLEPSSPGQPLQNGQSLGNSARLLANATGQPFASASFVTSFDQLALLLGGLTPPRSASLGWRELPAAGVNPRRWEVAVPIFTSAGFASLTIHTFNATNGRLIRSATLNNTTQFLPVLGWESALALDLTGDGIVGDGVLRSLGEGIYVTVSGRVWFDPDKVDGSLTRGQLPGSRARVLSNTLGAALARGSFEAGYDNLVMRLGSQASLGARIVGTTWEVAVPNFTASGFTSLTIHSFNAANGRLIRSTTLSAATQLTDIYAREILFGNSLVGRAGAVIGDRIERSLGGGLFVGQSRALYRSPAEVISQLPTASAVILRNAAGLPLSSSSFVTSFDQLALLLGGLTPPRSASLGWRELPAAGRNPRRWEVAVPNFTAVNNAPRFASLTIHTFNAGNGRLMGSATFNNTTQFLPVLGWESALALDLTGDGIVGDGVLRSLGKGIYVTVSGRVWFDPDKADGSLTRGQLPGSRARVLSNTLGAALARTGFEPGYDNLVTRLGSQASLGARVVGTTWEVAVPNFTSGVFASLTIHTFNQANGRLIRSATFLNSTQFASILTWESRFGLDLDGNGDPGFRFGGVQPGSSPVRVGAVELGLTQVGYALRIGTAIIPVVNNGTLVTASSLAGWTPAAAAAVGTGYQIFLRYLDGRYTQWNVNSAGVVIGRSLLTAGQRRLAEARLAYDINGDGIIGAGRPGIYMGQLATMQGGSGGFAFIVREDGTGAAIAYDRSSGLASGVPEVQVNAEGTFAAESVEGDEITGQVNGQNVQGGFSNAEAQVYGQFTGVRMLDSGTFAGGAGAYEGTFSGSGRQGDAYAIAAADGSFYFYIVNKTVDGFVTETSGGFGRLNSAGAFTTTLSDGIRISVTLNQATKTIAGAYFLGTQRLGNISLTLQPD